MAPGLLQAGELITRAEALFEQLKTSPEARNHMSHADALWRYRPYQGGEPYQSIDWRQSARTDRILVREAEPAHVSAAVFWMAPSLRANPHPIPVLLALGHFLAAQGRPMAWHDGQSRLTRTYAVFLQAFEHYFGNGFLTATLHQLPQATQLIVAADFSELDQDSTQLLQRYSAEGHRAILLHCSEKPLGPENTLNVLAQRLAWPIITVSTEAKEEAVLAKLLMIV